MIRAAFPVTMPEVTPLATPGEYSVVFHRLKALKRVEPEVRAGETLRVILAIDETGRVVRALAFTSEGQRDEQAEERLRQWEFEPFTVGGQPVRVITTLTLGRDR